MILCWNVCTLFRTVVFLLMCDRCCCCHCSVYFFFFSVSFVAYDTIHWLLKSMFNRSTCVLSVCTLIKSKRFTHFVHGTPLVSKRRLGAFSTWTICLLRYHRIRSLIHSPTHLSLPLIHSLHHPVIHISSILNFASLSNANIERKSIHLTITNPHTTH